jgi:hypothetical protein
LTVKGCFRPVLLLWHLWLIAVTFQKKTLNAERLRYEAAMCLEQGLELMTYRLRGKSSTTQHLPPFAILITVYIHSHNLQGARSRCCELGNVVVLLKAR